MPAELRDLRKSVPLLRLLRKDVASSGPAWLPLLLVLGATGAVAYADHLVVSVSLVYLYILPLGVGAIFLRREISYGLIVVCILFHDYYSPRPINPGLRIFHNLSAMLCFAFVVYVIQRYMEQREALAKTVQKQRDDLLKDVELNVKIELGRSRMLVEDVLKLSEGSVVELDKLAGDPVDVFVNDRLVARGEVLVLNDNFCVRINEIVAGVREEGM